MPNNTTNPSCPCSNDTKIKNDAIALLLIANARTIRHLYSCNGRWQFENAADVTALELYKQNVAMAETLTGSTYPELTLSVDDVAPPSLSQSASHVGGVLHLHNGGRPDA